jgi:uncharacterized protein DUF6518
MSAVRTTQTAEKASESGRATGTQWDVWRQACWVVAGSLVLGGATSWAQGGLPDALESFANSLSGWCVCTTLLVAAVRPTTSRGAALGIASFVCLVLGYTLASEARGLSYDPTFWVVVGVLGGPFVGAAAATLRGRRPMPDAAVGSGLLAGVLAADATYGLTVVADTTSPVYWTLVLVAAVLLVTVMDVLVLRSAAAIATQLAACLATFGVLYLGLTMVA